MKNRKKYKRYNISRRDYPSAELMCSASYGDYDRLIKTYDKIYDKISITLAFCSVVLLVILNSVDFSVLLKIGMLDSVTKYSINLGYLLSSVVSLTCMLWAVLQLLLLLRSSTITVFDSVAARNENIYTWTQEDAAVWLIDKYTNAVPDIKSKISDKQKKYDSAIIKIVISVVIYAIGLIIEKGVLG